MENQLQNVWECFKQLKLKMANNQNSATLQNSSLEILQAGEEFFFNQLDYDEMEQESIKQYKNELCNYITNFGQILGELSEQINSEIIEPLQQFNENYVETNNIIVLEGTEKIISLQKQKEALTAKQKHYVKSSRAKLRSQNQYEMLNIDIQNGLSKEINQLQQYKMMIENFANMSIDAEQAYKLQIELFNENLLRFKPEYSFQFENYNNNEESRISFIKITVNIFFKNMHSALSQISKILKQSHENIQQLEINQQQNNQTHDDLFSLSILQLLKTEQFQSYEDWEYQYNEEKNLQKQMFNKNFIEQDRHFADMVLRYLQLKQLICTNNHQLFESKECITPFSPTKRQTEGIETQFLSDGIQSTQELMISIKKFMNKENFSKSHVLKYFLDQVCHLSCIETNLVEIDLQLFNVFIFLVDIYTEFVQSRQENDDIFYKLVLFVTQFYYVAYDDYNKIKKIYLIDKCQQSTIWQIQKYWDHVYFLLIQKHTIQALNYYQKNKQLCQMDQIKAKSHTFSQFKKLKKKLRLEKTRLDNIIEEGTSYKPQKYKYAAINPMLINIESLEEINELLLNLNMEFNQSSKILINLSKQQSINKNQVLGLLEQQQKKYCSKLTLQTLCNQPTKYFSCNYYTVQKKFKKFQSLQIISIFLSLPYLPPNDLQTFFNLLLLDKKSHNLLKKHIYKQILSNDIIKFPLAKRYQVWESLLEVQRLKIDYTNLKLESSIQTQTKKDLRIIELIRLDVQRSFHNSKIINHLVLYNLLKTYAYFDKNIQYCQGMNFIMGFIFICYQDELQTFKVFLKVIEQVFNKILGPDLKKIKLYFYMLDRLIQLYLPDLYDHFKVAIINLLYIIIQRNKKQKVIYTHLLGY